MKEFYSDILEYIAQEEAQKIFKKQKVQMLKVVF